MMKSMDEAPMSAPPTILSEPNVDARLNPKKLPLKTTIATPNDAPLVIPRIDGPASGFLKRVCINHPLNAKAIPPKMEERVRGSLDSNTITRFGPSSPCPVNMEKTSLKGIVIDPKMS